MPHGLADRCRPLDETKRARAKAQTARDPGVHGIGTRFLGTPYNSSDHVSARPVKVTPCMRPDAEEAIGKEQTSQCQRDGANASPQAASRPFVRACVRAWRARCIVREGPADGDGAAAALCGWVD